MEFLFYLCMEMGVAISRDKNLILNFRRGGSCVMTSLFKVKVYVSYFDNKRYIKKSWKVYLQRTVTNKYEAIIRLRFDDRSVYLFENFLLSNRRFCKQLMCWLPSCCHDDSHFLVTKTASLFSNIKFWIEAYKTYVLPLYCIIVSWRLFHPLLVARIQLEYICACLSTLGGAHSSLGDFSEKHSYKAALVSQQQYVVAKKMNDPILMHRCRIYYAHSLLQRGELKKAAKIIRSVYCEAKSSKTDVELVLTCCRAAWSKFKYLRKCNRFV
ncbi:uncharacterized protein LOC101241757 isoform X3 [Hydra vulgaris]|uniref:uncharacterized protein LOC101241757 isoform X3 n=1 Tax=Hydra vulgaris TaxID=6087 RepID=UPI001F5F5D50|nr:uncharacterized protein LOC101241757 isoform X3 [Hydra vulgaris]